MDITSLRTGLVNGDPSKGGGSLHTVTQFGTRSHLLMMRTTCLCAFSFLM